MTEEQPPDDPAERSRDLFRRLGAGPPDDAKVAVLERLAELHASGAMTQEAYDREKRRLLDY